MSVMLESLEKMLASGKDNALLRFSLGSEYVKIQRYDQAVEHLQLALVHDPAYSAAWKLFGKALQEAQRLPEALAAYRSGIAVAESKGDKQAAKEMTVFAKRIEKQLGNLFDSDPN